MALADELAYMTATEMAARIRRRQLSPVEVVDAVIERIEERNPSLNAFVFKGYDDARERARAAERAVTSGADLGPLHGVPCAMKDLFDFKPGWNSTFGGVRALKDFVLDAYCVFAERVERAGAILIGKTNSPVMGFRGVCDNYLFGPSCNPFDTTVNTGGSSGGSAAAVADGLVPFAEGSDGGGSIRIPAAWCGVYGYKASFGRVPMVFRPDAFAGTNPYIFEGPLTRTVEDAALVLNALSGYDPRDPYSLDEDVDFLPATRRGIRGMRIAYSPDLDVFPVDPRIAQVVREAVDAFKEAGAHVEEVKVGITRDQRELSDLWCRLIIPLSCVAFQRMKAGGFDILGEHREDFPPGVPLLGRQVHGHDRARADERPGDAHGGLRRAPGRARPLRPARHADADRDAGQERHRRQHARPRRGQRRRDRSPDRLVPDLRLQLLGPSGCIHSRPASPTAFPVGLQIIGRRYGDADVLAASAAFERLRPWHDSYTRCAERSLV